MAEAKKKIEKVGAREVWTFPDGTVIWGDTGEACDVGAVEEYKLLFAGADAEGAKHEAVNAAILFWVKMRVEGEDEKKNPIRGFLLEFFEPPASFASASDDEDEDEAQSTTSAGARQRLACWVKITMPCWVKNQNKEIVLATVGSIVWVDVTHANNSLVTAARPLMGKDLKTTGVVEIEVVPLRKVAFPSKTKKGETWSAWKMRVSGGWRQAKDDMHTKRKGGFRVFTEAEIEKLGHRLYPPEVIDMAKARELAGVAAPAYQALPPGRDEGLPALPAHTTN